MATGYHAARTMRKTENTLLWGWDGGCKIEDRAEKKNPIQGV